MVANANTAINFQFVISCNGGGGGGSGGGGGGGGGGAGGGASSLSFSPSPQVLIGPPENQAIHQIITEHMWGVNDPITTTIDHEINLRLSAGFRGPLQGCSRIRFSKQEPMVIFICGTKGNFFEISVNLNQLITTNEDLIKCEISGPILGGIELEGLLPTKKSRFGLEELPSLGGEIQDKVGVRVLLLSFASVLRTLILSKDNERVRAWVEVLYDQTMEEVFVVMKKLERHVRRRWFDFISTTEPVALSLDKKASKLIINWPTSLQELPNAYRGLFLLQKALKCQKEPGLTFEMVADKSAFYLAAKQDTKALRQHFPCFQTSCETTVEHDDACAEHIRQLLGLVLDQGTIGDKHEKDWFENCFHNNTTSIKQCAEVLLQQMHYQVLVKKAADQHVEGWLKVTENSTDDAEVSREREGGWSQTCVCLSACACRGR